MKARRIGIAGVITATAWTLAAGGLYGWSLVALFGLVVCGAVWALGDLSRRRECHVCGLPYTVGRLGAHERCLAEIRGGG